VQNYSLLKEELLNCYRQFEKRVERNRLAFPKPMAWIGLDRDDTGVLWVLGNDLARASDLIGKEADVELDHLLAVGGRNRSALWRRVLCHGRMPLYMCSQSIS